MKNRAKYGLCIFFVVALAGAYLWNGKILQQDAITRLRLLCDGFTVPGVLLLCAGVLGWARRRGVLCGIGYGLRSAYRALIPSRLRLKEESYHQYLARKRATAKGDYQCLLITGGVSVGISLVFFLLYTMKLG